MNIAKLLGPIGLRLKRQASLQDTEQTDDRYEPIVAPNEMKNHQRSYFKEYSQFEVQMSSQMTERTQQDEEERKISRLAMIDNELEGIERMKNQFQKRKKTENQNSIDKLANRSIDRHHLKPSIIPKITVNTSEFSVNSSETQPLKQKSKQDPCGIKIQGYNGETIFLDHDSLFELEPNSDKKQANPSLQPFEPRASREQCNCQLDFKAFMNEAKQKLSEVELRVEQIQHYNAGYRKQISQYCQDNQNLLRKISRLQNQRKEVQNLHFPEINKKTEFNQVLKEINHQSTCKTQKYAFFEQSKTNKQNIQTESLKKKPNNSKVQSLLQRLQLRIQKTS